MRFFLNLWLTFCLTNILCRRWSDRSKQCEFDLFVLWFQHPPPKKSNKKNPKIGSTKFVGMWKISLVFWGMRRQDYLLLIFTDLYQIIVCFYSLSDKYLCGDARNNNAKSFGRKKSTGEKLKRAVFMRFRFQFGTIVH